MTTGAASTERATALSAVHGTQDEGHFDRNEGIDRIRVDVAPWRWAIVKSELPSPVRHVLLTLAVHMQRSGDSCFPSIATVAGETGLGRSTVYGALRQADDRGYLIRSDRGGGLRAGGKRGRPVSYFAAVPETVLRVDGSNSPGDGLLEPDKDPRDGREGSTSGTGTVREPDPNSTADQEQGERQMTLSCVGNRRKDVPPTLDDPELDQLAAAFVEGVGCGWPVSQRGLRRWRRDFHDLRVEAGANATQVYDCARAMARRFTDDAYCTPGALLRSWHVFERAVAEEKEWGL